MSNDLREPGLDELLEDVKQLLEQDAPISTGDARFYEELHPAEDLPVSSKPHSWAETQRLPRHVAKLQRNQEQAYADWLQTQDANRYAAPEPEREHAAETLNRSWAETQRLPRHVAKLQRNQEQAYADWLYAQGQDEPYTPPPIAEETAYAAPEKPEKKKKKKKRHILRNLVLTLLLFALLAMAAVIFLLPSQPTATKGTLGARRDGVSTILLVGTDEGGARTDTLILLTLDQSRDQATLVSIPRDTLVNGSYAVPKINSVYGANGGGEAGMDMLMERVSQCIGFRPDGYVLLDLQLVADYIDAIGGVRFQVPMDMSYADPSQGLVIDLKQGDQRLNGQQALQLLRFRSGYADQDLGRIQVQRAFLSALMEQTVSMDGILKSPKLLDTLLQAHTDLSTRNLLWLARTAMTLDLSKVETATLPGNAVWINGGSYYVLEPALVAQTVNTYCNPYTWELTAGDLQIRTE